MTKISAADGSKFKKRGGEMSTSQALTHAQKVTRLYRKSLKNMLSWTIVRQVWREDAVELRAIFDENKHVDVAEATRLLEKGEKIYERHKHPDPYIGEWNS